MNDDQFDFMKNCLNLQRMLNEAKAQMEDPVYRAEHIRKCNELYPDLITEQVSQLLQVRSKSDISAALVTLYHLRERGVSVVWEKIKPELRTETRNKFGTIFNDEAFAAGRNMPIDIGYLGMFLAKQINAIEPSEKKQFIRALKVSGSHLTFFPMGVQSNSAGDEPAKANLCSPN